MMRVNHFIRQSFLLMFVMFASGSSLAIAGACGPLPNGPRLDLTLPSGCVSSYYFQRQMDEPKDQKRPRAETPADTTRRLKSLNDWRQSTAKTDTAIESKK